MDEKKKTDKKKDDPVKTVPACKDEDDEEFEEDFLIFELTEEEDEQVSRILFLVYTVGYLTIVHVAEMLSVNYCLLEVVCVVFFDQCYLLTIVSEYFWFLSMNWEHLFGFYLADSFKYLGSRCVAGGVKLILVVHAVQLKVEQVQPVVNAFCARARARG